jgi:hypothetical protein
MIGSISVARSASAKHQVDHTLPRMKRERRRNDLGRLRSPLSDSLFLVEWGRSQFRLFDLQQPLRSGSVARFLIEILQRLLCDGDVLHGRAGADPEVTDDRAAAAAANC